MSLGISLTYLKAKFTFRYILEQFIPWKIGLTNVEDKFVSDFMKFKNSIKHM